MIAWRQSSSYQPSADTLVDSRTARGEAVILLCRRRNSYRPSVDFLVDSRTGGSMRQSALEIWKDAGLDPQTVFLELRKEREKFAGQNENISYVVADVATAPAFILYVVPGNRSIL